MSALIRGNASATQEPGSPACPEPGSLAAALNSPADPPRGPAPASPEPTPPAAESRADRLERAYSFGAYLRSRAGFAFGVIALIAVVAGIMAGTGSNASAIALVPSAKPCSPALRLLWGFCATASSTSSWTCSAIRTKTRATSRRS